MDVSEESEPERHCWVCFATEEDDPGAAWVRPCNCKGTSKWVHQKCVQRWVDEKQKGNPVSKVACPQCNTTYLIIYPDMGPFVFVLDAINSLIYKACPFIAAGLIAGSVYWVLVTYGAVTVIQVLGQEEGQELLEMSEPWFLLIALPTIPVALILGKMIHWEDTVLTFFRRHISKLALFPSLRYGSDVGSGGQELYPPPPPPTHMSDPGLPTRVFCSALVFPTIAVAAGNVFFRSIKSQAQRTALGAVTFLVIKGALTLFHKQQQYTRKRQRKIMDWTAEPSLPSV